MLLTAVNLAEGDLNRSFDGFQEARKFHGQKNFVRAIFGENCGVFGLAITEMGIGNLAAARHLLTQYLQQAIEVQRLDLMYYALCGHVKLNQQLGDPTNAIYLWRMISSHPFIHNSRWFNRLILIPLQMQVPVEDESWHRQLEQRSIWDLASDLIESKAR
jgi:hypothetical protein